MLLAFLGRGTRHHYADKVDSYASKVDSYAAKVDVYRLGKHLHGSIFPTTCFHAFTYRQNTDNLCFHVKAGGSYSSISFTAIYSTTENYSEITS